MANTHFQLAMEAQICPGSFPADEIMDSCQSARGFRKIPELRDQSRSESRVVQLDHEQQQQEISSLLRIFEADLQMLRVRGEVYLGNRERDLLEAMRIEKNRMSRAFGEKIQASLRQALHQCPRFELNEDKCPICWAFYREVTPTQQIVYLSCGHSIHAECLQRRDPLTNRPLVQDCPTCRARLDPRF